MLNIGDTVKIRGDLRINYSIGKPVCAYFPDQLIDGKYVKHTGTGEIWTGKVTKITECGEYCLVGGAYWHVRLLEKA